jgi:hypothetical protein
VQCAFFKMKNSSIRGAGNLLNSAISRVFLRS